MGSIIDIPAAPGADPLSVAIDARIGAGGGGGGTVDDATVAALPSVQAKADNTRLNPGGDIGDAIAANTAGLVSKADATDLAAKADAADLVANIGVVTALGVEVATLQNLDGIDDTGTFIRMTPAERTQLADLILADLDARVDILEGTPPPVDITPPTWPGGNLSISLPAGSTTLALQWTEAQDIANIATYEVYDGATLIQTNPASDRNHIVPGLTADTTYTYTIQATDTNGNQSTDGPSATFTTAPVANAAPTWPGGSTLTTGTITESSVELNWTAATDDVLVSGYTVFRRPSGGTYVPVIGTTGLSFNDTGLAGGATYDWKVEAYDEDDNATSTGPTVTASTTVAADTTPPTWPSSTLTISNPAATSFIATWPTAIDDTAVAGYNVYKRIGAAAFALHATITNGSTTATIAPLTSSTTYEVEVKAFDEAGNESTVGNPSAFGTTQAQAPIVTGNVLISPAELAALPTTGDRWQAVLDEAGSSWDASDVDLVDQDNKVNSKVLAGAIVAARLGDTAMQSRVEACLASLPSKATGRVLSLGRQLGGYVMAADLIGYRPTAFTNWVDTIRTLDIGGHGRWYALSQCSGNSANNWGTFCMASRIVASAYLGDADDLAEAANILRRFTGDKSINHVFQETGSFNGNEKGWAYGYPDWDPINPAVSDATYDGGLPEDLSRETAYPVASGSGLSYSTEAIQGLIVDAIVLQRNGYPDVWSWQDNAICRTVAFLDRFDVWPSNGVDEHINWIVNNRCGTSFAKATNPGPGRLISGTVVAWLYG